MPKLSNADKAAARKAAAAKAAATRAANKAAKAETAQADAPILTDAKPAELTASARHAGLMQAAIAAGADASNVRSRTSIAVAVAGTKAMRHAPDCANYAKRFSSVSEKTQIFLTKLINANGFEPYDAEPHDAGKQARCLSNGLIVLAGNSADGVTKSGHAALVPPASGPLLFRAVDPADDTFQADEQAEAEKRAKQAKA